ncbi:MAG: response regulator transcription factor [Candidatus Gracilibacteria bacterium]|jgi:DNA-binding response OmpR family regulator
MQKTILIIEDDAKIADLIGLYLEKEGFHTVHSANGLEGLEIALKIKPILIVLDRMLPQMEGLEVLKQLRMKEKLPVLILSAKSDEIEKIIGLELGADDYLSKPFSPKELVARVKAILRRSNIAQIYDKEIAYKDLVLNPEKMLVTKKGLPIKFSPLEFKLFFLMATHPGRVFTREQLMHEIYDSNQKFVFDRTIDAHIKNIRHHLGDSPKSPKYISSVFGAGYKLLENENINQN